MEGVTRESIRPLLDLQRVDSTLDRLKQRKADLPEQRALDDLTAQRAETQKSTAGRQETFDKAARDQAKLEAEIASMEDKISHESNRLYSGDISNPKELAAIQAELDGLRRRKQHVEDQLLAVMEDREKAEGALGETKAKLDELAAAIEVQTAARDAAAVEIEKELGEAEAERNGIVTGIPEEVLAIYEDLRAKKNGVGAAKLDGNVCRGCGVSLSPLAMDKIRRDPDALIRCENCRRILVP
jgi:predicted  nucleic acid-binding Zn-ribbon protein